MHSCRNVSYTICKYDISNVKKIFITMTLPTLIVMTHLTANLAVTKDLYHKCVNYHYRLYLSSCAELIIAQNPCNVTFDYC